MLHCITALLLTLMHSEDLARHEVRTSILACYAARTLCIFALTAPAGVMFTELAHASSVAAQNFV